MTTETRYCTECGGEIRSDRNECSQCRKTPLPIESASETEHCQECGQQLRAGADFCNRCGTDQSKRGRVSAVPSTREQTSRSSDDEDTTRRALKGFAAFVLVVAGAMLIAAFVLGLGDDTGQSDAEEAVMKYYQAVSDGDDELAAARIHSDSPITEGVSNASPHLVPANGQVTVLSSDVVEDEGESLVLDITVNIDEFGGEPRQFEVRVELRSENGQWRVWDFPR